MKCKLNRWRVVLVYDKCITHVCCIIFDVVYRCCNCSVVCCNNVVTMLQQCCNNVVVL